MMQEIIQALYGTHASCESQQISAWYAEAIRTIVWAHTVGANTAEQSLSTRSLLHELAVHTPASILNSINHDFAEDWHDAEQKPKRPLLEALGTLRDIQDVGSGQWTPCPLRCVKIDEHIQDQLVVGTLPTQLMPDTWQARLEVRGMRRLLHHGPLSVEGQGEWWWPATLDAWLGPKPPTWEIVLQRIAEVSLQSYQPRYQEKFQAYRPTADRSQYYRWEAVRHVPDGRQLLRQKGEYGGYWYTLAQVQSGAICAITDGLPTGPRRIMYALDAQAHRSVIARRYVTKEEVCFELYNELPAYEQRLTIALGQRESVRPGAYYPFLLRVARSHADFIGRVLQSLNIEIREEQGA